MHTIYTFWPFRDIFIQSEIRELERTREAMARELVTLSEANSDQAEQLEQHETLKKTYQVSE